MSPDRAEEIENLIDRLVDEEHELAGLLRELLDAAIEHSQAEILATEAATVSRDSCVRIAAILRHAPQQRMICMRIAEHGAGAWQNRLGTMHVPTTVPGPGASRRLDPRQWHGPEDLPDGEVPDHKAHNGHRTVPPGLLNLIRLFPETGTRTLKQLDRYLRIPETTMRDRIIRGTTLGLLIETRKDRYTLTPEGHRVREWARSQK